MSQGHDNAADEGSAVERRKKADLNREQEIADIKALAEIPAFQRWVRRKLGECYVFSTTFDRHGTQFALREGMRNVGLKIVAELNDNAPEALVKVLIKQDED